MLADVTFVPEQASTLASSVDHVFLFIMGTTGSICVVVAFLIVYFAVKYRRKPGVPAKQIHGSTPLELIWTGIPLFLTMIMFAWSSKVYFDIMRAPDDSLEVYCVGRQWMWKMQHPDGQREINELHVPVGQPVKVIITSEDVIHSLFIPDFRVKQDAVPGRYTSLWFQATKPGRYRIYCAEYCGSEHSKMVGWVVAQEPTEYLQWLSSRADQSLALKGRKLFLKYQCVTCHSGDAQARAPSLEAIFQQNVPLQDNKSVVADDNYLRESILAPRAKVVAGYEPIMPTYQGMPESDLIELVAFIKSLKLGGTPSRNEASTATQSDPKSQEPKPFQN